MKNYNNPLVSVIIPFLNAEQYLVETIESVLKQEYKNWEIILVDDGSTDESTQIAKECAYKYSGKIFYFEHDGHVNKAAAASRNLGLSNARGELVAFLDADDIWLPNKLQEQVAIFQRYPEVKMVCEASIYWYSWKDINIKDEKIFVGVTPDKIYKPPELAIKLYPLTSGDAPCPSGIVVNTSVLKKHNGFEESFTGKYQVFEDQAFLSKLYLNEYVYVSSLCNNLYRQRKDSVMSETNSFGYYHTAKLFYLKWLKNYLDKHNFKNNILHFLLWKAFLPYKHPFLSRVVNKIERIYLKF